MGEISAIEWTNSTFNPWWGCLRVSPGCEHCYAETFSNRLGLKIWGPAKTTERRLFGEKHWNEPRRWNKKAERTGKRHRVFCASMADVFEDHPQLPAERDRLWGLIEDTPWLDWQLLTKRPENVLAMVPPDWIEYGFPHNVWVGTSVEDQRRADERIVELIKIPARIRFLSVEPLLGPVSLRWLACAHEATGETYREYLERRGSYNEYEELRQIHWVIVGGESGAGARSLDVSWVREIVAQCKEAGVAVFVKQLGAAPSHNGSSLNEQLALDGGYRPVQMMRLRDKKGGDMSEWPPDLRIREMPLSASNTERDPDKSLSSAADNTKRTGTVDSKSEREAKG